MAVNDACVVLCAVVFVFAAYKPIRTQPPPNWPGWNQNNGPPLNWQGWANNPPPNWNNMPPPNWPGWWINNNAPSTQPTPTTRRLAMVDMLYCDMMCDDYDYDRAASSTSMDDLVDAIFGDPCEECPTRPPTTTPRMSMNVNMFPPSGMNMTMMRSGDNWMMNVWPMATPAPNSAQNPAPAPTSSSTSGSSPGSTSGSTPRSSSGSTPGSTSGSTPGDGSTTSGIEELLPKNYLIIILISFLLKDFLMWIILH